MQEIDIFKLNSEDLITSLKNDNEGLILKILNPNQIEKLKESSKMNNVVSSILMYSKFKDKLLENEEFIEILLKCDKLKIFKELKKISVTSSDNIIRKCIKDKMPKEEILKLLKILNPEYQIKALDRYKLTYDDIHKFLGFNPPMNVIKKIFNKYNVDLSNNRINIDKFFYQCRIHNEREMHLGNKENYIYFNDSFFTNSFLNKIWNENSIFKLRLLINNINYSADISKINDFIKAKENEMIYCIDETTIKKEFINLLDVIKSYNESLDKQDIANINQYERKYYELIEELNKKNIYVDQSKVGLTADLETARNYLQDQTQKEVSNAIIDYHFEDNYHNVIIDLRELLEFNRRGNIKLSKEKLSFYNNIVNIDELSLEEKRKLHEQLKHYNMKEIFYDDIRKAKDIAIKDIKNSSLNKEKLEDYYDEKLSRKYGVKIYNLTGKAFVGIVKTGRKINNENRGGHSFSLVGDEHLTIYGDTKKSDTYFYDSDTLNIGQIVHEYPADSHSYYNPTEDSNPPTSRTYKLNTARELLHNTKTFNELLILEKGTNPTDMDRDIPILEKLGLYCIDTISENDIIKAKNNNVGIIYVDSSEHKKIFPKNLSVKEMNELYEDGYFQSPLDLFPLEEKRK